MTTRVAIVGIGMTSFGKFLDRSVRTSAEEAVRNALADAGIGAERVDRVFFGNAAAGLITGQEMVRAQAALRHTGLLGKPMVSVENACATGSTAFHLAWHSVASGQSDVAMAVGAEKLSHPDKAVSFGAFGGAVDKEDVMPSHIGSGSGSIFMDIYAERTRRYMKATGTTPADFARITVKSRRAGAMNPYAQFRKETTVEEVLAARMISEPLTLPMCSSIGDGAAAIVLVSSRVAAQLTGCRPVWVASSVLLSGMADPTKPSASVSAAKAAYKEASIGPDEVHVAEVHDASAPGELINYEVVQFCPEGQGVELLRSGATDIGGRISVNPSGGLLSRGHPIGATGAAQIAELVQQLRGEAGERQRKSAKVALAQNSGGQVGHESAVAVVSILTA
ncbi:thiolase family protein [Paraburkholderia sp. MM5384-R2]|uniref:thiolase family protein n=1 Tax=Paraburkholderia sp. MM5384-R2 TaxID=2723097 RepID=UPI001614E169|nr:thiolase family protein [Paraburkholderia sp. MM5384-R2]MBB5497562.1 acetyl-CoA acetyltransferase [Paraburkholderia sp. MM5384-R2]